MEKELKDYLYLYPGCDCRIYEEDMIDFTIDKLQGCYLNKAVFNGYGVSIRLVKPLLRPLESMTEEEKKELNHLDDHALFELGDGSGYALPYVFTWLLHKHFDLFGLIPAEKAIDKTKQ